jgi:hypothetical protein
MFAETPNPVERQSVADLAMIKMGGEGVELSRVELKHQDDCAGTISKVV